MNLPAQEFRGFANQVLEGFTTRLVNLRDHHHSDQMAAEDTPNRHDVLLAAIEIQIGFRRHADGRAGIEQCSPRGSFRRQGSTLVSREAAQYLIQFGG